jgi:hypothetical protein
MAVAETNGLCEAAAGSGSLLVLQWAREHGCPWNRDTCSEAAMGVYMGVLQWAREQGCPSMQQALARVQQLESAYRNACPWDGGDMISSSWRWASGSAAVGQEQCLLWDLGCM